MQSKEELDQWYASPDPWGYQMYPDDLERKKRILAALLGRYERALDIGAGEGWITKDLPARRVYAYEISDNAKNRLPPNVKPVTEPKGKYDLILATGVLYRQYDHEAMLRIIKAHASKTVLIAGIKDWLVDLSTLGEPVHMEEFRYRDYTQELRVYRWT